MEVESTGHGFDYVLWIYELMPYEGSPWTTENSREGNGR
jgi:hypothetical protein